MVSIDVENHGPEIEAKALRQIFEPLFTTKPGGTGLGLAIARNAALSHGGNLLLTENSASTVKFTPVVSIRGIEQECCSRGELIYGPSLCCRR
jgi:signal transduction histidine kinase